MTAVCEFADVERIFSCRFQQETTCNSATMLKIITKTDWTNLIGYSLHRRKYSPDFFTKYWYLLKFSKWVPPLARGGLNLLTAITGDRPK